MSRQFRLELTGNVDHCSHADESLYCHLAISTFRIKYSRRSLQRIPEIYPGNFLKTALELILYNTLNFELTYADEF
jgi:hypothetical protein